MQQKANEVYMYIQDITAMLRCFVLQHWDSKAARHAQEWADNCNGPAHGNHPNEGQNYAAAYPAKNVFKR